LVALYLAEILPSDNVLLHYHHQYYNLIRHLACFLSLRFLIERTFLIQAKVSQVPDNHLSNRVITITPEASQIKL
jgi:hypothetical protein